MTLKIHNENYKKKRPKTSLYNKDFPCEIHIRYKHNHRTDVLQALSFRAVSESTKKAMLQLFEKRMTPSLAYAEMKHSMYKQSNDEHEYEKKLAGWAFIPRKGDFKNLYKEFNQQLYGGNGEALFSRLGELAEQYSKNHKEEGGMVKYMIEENKNSH